LENQNEGRYTKQSSKRENADKRGLLIREERRIEKALSKGDPPRWKYQ
jgi:hypothetical protein